MSETIDSPKRLTQEMEDEIMAKYRTGKEAAHQAHLERAAQSLPPPIPNPEQRRFEAECKTCGQPFMAIEMEFLGLKIGSMHCDSCVDAYRAAQNAPAPRHGAPEVWAALCPSEYRTVDEGGATVIARLQRECPKLREVTGWQFGPQGLLVRGDTGHCKTRAVWRLLREQFDAGRSIAAMSSGRFAKEFADAAMNGTATAWFDRLATADIYFLDDLGKKPWTENAWGEFFELVDERAKNHRPFILTTNEGQVRLDDGRTVNSLSLKCKDPVTWEPLNRRLKENCRQIVL